MDSVEILKIAGAAVGAVTGSIALGWRVVDEFGSFLRISLEAEAPKDGWITLLTTIENKGYRPKQISYAILLIGPENESPLQTARQLATEAKYDGPLLVTNDLEFFRIDQPLALRDRMLIPLPFYYSENVNIADETLTYRVPINLGAFAAASPYAVRYFIFASPRLHRTTEDTFIITEAASTA